MNEAAANGWATVEEVTALNCASSEIEDLTGLEALTSLETLDLTDIPAILCTDLDALEVALPNTTITRPNPCNTGGGGPQASQVQALHNALGQRVIKTVNGTTSSTIHFIYDQAGQVIAEMDAATGETLREYIYVNGQQVAIVDDTGTANEATYFVHNDHLGTPQKITDSSQSIVWNATYQPFGEVEVTTAEIENNIRFPGQYADQETGLHYNYFRDYDPTLGRYVESDPIGLFGGINTFAYVGSNPIEFTDIKGLKKVTGIYCRTGCTLTGDKCGNCPKGLVISGTGTSPTSRSVAEVQSVQNFNLAFSGLNCACYGKRTVCSYVYRDDYSDKLKDFLGEPFRWLDHFLWLRNPSQSNQSPMLGGPRG